jgi:hypothetical protein
METEGDNVKLGQIRGEMVSSEYKMSFMPGGEKSTFSERAESANFFGQKCDPPSTNCVLLV